MRLSWLALFAALLFPVIANANPQGNLVNATTLTITTGGTWQALFPANNNRSTLWVQNPCSATSQGIATAENLFIAFSATVPVAAPTAGGYYELGNCGSFVMTSGYVSRQPIWIYAATTSHAFGAMDTQ